MSVKIAITYLIGLFSNKIQVYLSFAVSFAMQPIIKILTTHFQNEQVNLPVFSISLLIFITFILIIIEYVSSLGIKKNKEKSSTLGELAGKVFGLFIYYTLSVTLIMMIYNSMFALTIIFGPVVLTILKEFTTIGENLEKIYGRKSYLFTIVDKLFEILEFKYFNKIKEGTEEEIVNKTNNNE